MDDGEQLGVMKKNEAIDIAQGRGLDLVEIAPNNKPPVCKIVDYGKFKYQEQKKKNEAAIKIQRGIQGTAKLIVDETVEAMDGKVKEVKEEDVAFSGFAEKRSK